MVDRKKYGKDKPHFYLQQAEKEFPAEWLYKGPTEMVDGYSSFAFCAKMDKTIKSGARK